jgi:hypothetical protein
MSRAPRFPHATTFVETSPGRSQFYDSRRAGAADARGDRRILPRGLENHRHSVDARKCPLCNRPGPVDVHRSYVAWSIFLVPVWSSMTQICCRSCGTRLRLGAIAFSVVFGLWGVPFCWIIPPLLRSPGGASVGIEWWGLFFGAIITPIGLIACLNRINFCVQVARNLIGITVGPNRTTRSVALELIMRSRAGAPESSRPRPTPGPQAGPASAEWESPHVVHLGR